MDSYFVWDVVHFNMGEPKYCDKQLIPKGKELIKILMEMCSFIQNLGLLPLVSNVPKINMCEPKYCDKQLIPKSKELIKILMETCSFIQNLGLLPLVSNVPKTNPTL